MTKICFLFCFINIAAIAENITWLTISPTFRYKDLTAACSSFNFPKNIYFGAEVLGKNPTAAVLKDNSRDVVSFTEGIFFTLYGNRILFSKDELPEIEFFQDEFGRHWLKSLSLSARHVAWILAYAGGALGCKPPQPITSVTPSPFVFNFNNETLNEYVNYSSTPQATFKGQRQDGGPYTATLEFTQEQFTTEQGE